MKSFPIADKRKLYDRYGDEWQRYKDAGYTGDEPQNAGRRTQTPTISARGLRVVAVDRHRLAISDRSSDHSDFFETLFGSFGGGRRNSDTFTRATPRPRRGQDIDAEVEVSFDEAFRGTTRAGSISRPRKSVRRVAARAWYETPSAPHATAPAISPASRRSKSKIPAGVTNGSRIRVGGQGGVGERRRSKWRCLPDRRGCR